VFNQFVGRYSQPVKFVRGDVAVGVDNHGSSLGLDWLDSWMVGWLVSWLKVSRRNLKLQGKLFWVLQGAQLNINV
jgi:hypothetical protein